MKVTYRIPLLLFFILLINVLQAQLDPNKITHFDELSGTTIYEIETDRMGNLWIGTQSGLVKFDGYEYTRFHPDLTDSTTMGELLVYEIFEDQQGFLWIGCQDAIYKYNPRYKSFKRILFDHLIDTDEFGLSGVGTIVSDNQGRIYFGITSMAGFPASKALIYYDETLDSLISYPYPDSMNLQSVYRSALDPDGNIWLLDFSGVYKIDPQHEITEIPEPDGLVLTEFDFLNGIMVDSSGILWSTTTEGKLIEYNTSTGKTNTWNLPEKWAGAFDNVFMLDLIDGPEPFIWITSQFGILRFDKTSGSFESFRNRAEHPLLRNQVLSLHRDAFGNLWMGTESVGLLNYSDKPMLSSHIWSDYDSTTITSGWVYRILESENGEVWIATRGGLRSGITRMDPATGSIIPYLYESITPGMFWQDILTELRSGEWLVRMNNAYKIFNTSTLSVRDTTLKFLPQGPPVVFAHTDSHSKTWFCSYNGLYVYDAESKEGKRIDMTTFPGTLSSANMVTRVVESERYGLWIITDYGLFSYDYQSEEIVRHAYDSTQGPVLLSHDINSFYEDPDGIAWVGTWQGGLNKYDPRTGAIKVYTVYDGLPSMSIQGILPDEKNNDLWLSTFQGISRFDLETEQFTNFSLADGIQGLLYADGQYLKTSGNLFIFGGSNGITWFNPEKIRQRSNPPNIFITDFKIADQSKMDAAYILSETNDKDRYTFSHGQNSISIEYTGIQYDDPEKNAFAYILENYDEAWREVGNIRSAFYYNLPPGTYTFRVKAANSNGIWNETGAFLQFEIRPPWWLTWWAYILYGLLFMAVIISFDRIQRRRLLAKQQRIAREKELAQAKEIEKAYHELKQTQQQLVHAEKMASLGELTAGIAHEIQNPLNFVNNFSELSAELADEMKEELAAGNRQLAEEIADDIIQNLEKIHHHGKRADGIVKGMLQHSRSGNGRKEPTDINALADEYLRLSYHGLRAKDKSFNADFKLEADKNLPKVPVVPQDFGRVLLNLINNAFFAVNEKSKESSEGYKPEVLITAKKVDNKMVIRVSDNGRGIPNNIKDKIFQPFFTTKPSGEGTGLGLSLSYDIITKGHGGALKVETQEGKGAHFIIEIPIDSI